MTTPSISPHIQYQPIIECKVRLPTVKIMNHEPQKDVSANDHGTHEDTHLLGLAIDADKLK